MVNATAMAGHDETGTAEPDPLLTAVGERIESLRAAKGVEPADLARAANVTLQYLWRVRKGKVNLNLKSISRFSIALGVEMAALLEGIDADPATLEKRRYEHRSDKEG